MEREGERKEGREEEREGGIINFLVSPHAWSLIMFKKLLHYETLCNKILDPLLTFL